MIPVHTASLYPIDMKILANDDKASVDYKNLLSNQIRWCNKAENRNFIILKAQKLYDTITNKTARPELVKICCNFSLAEEQYLIYCNIQNLKI